MVGHTGVGSDLASVTLCVLLMRQRNADASLRLWSSRLLCGPVSDPPSSTANEDHPLVPSRQEGPSGDDDTTSLVRSDRQLKPYQWRLITETPVSSALTDGIAYYHLSSS